jgi:hypothetical protein
MVRFSRREGIFLMLGASQALLLGAASAAVTYDDLVDTFDIPPDSSVVSYWKFENDGADEKGTQDAVITGSPELNVDTIVDHDTISEGAPVDGKCIAWSGTTGVHAQAGHNPAHSWLIGKRKSPERAVAFIVRSYRDQGPGRRRLRAARGRRA